MADSRREHHALIVVDPQPDFFESGPLPIPGATAIAEKIADYLRDNVDNFSMTVVTQDWHIDPGAHWSDDPDFVTKWPVHCAANTSGADIYSSLRDQHWDAVIRKGQHDGAYSGFQGTSDDGSTLEEVLKSAGVERVTIVGFATDYCVKATSLDARTLGFEVNVVLDLCAGVHPATSRDAITSMANAGVVFREVDSA